MFPHTRKLRKAAATPPKPGRGRHMLLRVGGQPRSWAHQALCTDVADPRRQRAEWEQICYPRERDGRGEEAHPANF